MSEREDIFTAAAEGFLKNERSEIRSRLSNAHHIEAGILKAEKIQLGRLAKAQHAIDFIDANLKALRDGHIPLSKFVEVVHKVASPIEPVAVVHENGTGILSSIRILGASIEAAMSLELPKYKPGQGSRSDRVLDWEKALIRTIERYFSEDFTIRAGKDADIEDPDFPLYDRVANFLREAYGIERSVHTIRTICETKEASLSLPKS